MSARWQLTAVTLCVILAAPFALHADIYRWDNGRGDSGDGGDYAGAGGAVGPSAVGVCQVGGWIW